MNSARNSTEATIVIIGAGVVGCAIAYELSEKGFSPWILEKGPRIAEGVTSRNSGVIHAGLYYPPGSLKANSCIRGSALLYEWCRKKGVPHRQTGKWIVADASQEAGLHEIYSNARASGAQGLSLVSQKTLRDRAPGVQADIAIYSELTGIVDAYEYSRSLLHAAESRGAQCLTSTEITAVERSGLNYLLNTSRGEIRADWVINSAGLYADQVAKMAGVDRYQIYPWKGHYFRLQTAFRHDSLVYPVKEKNAAGLGVHLTLGLDGSVKLGPDVEPCKEKEDFSAPAQMEERKIAFFKAASKYLAGIKLEDLHYDTCGIRPKLRAPGDSQEKDFVISQDLPGWINLVGIESPGLTASRDLAQRVIQMLV